MTTSARVFLQYHLEKAGFRVLLATGWPRGARPAVRRGDRRAARPRACRSRAASRSCGTSASRTPTSRPIIVTSSSEIADAVEAMRSGAFDYVTKPVKVDELIECVQRAVRTSQLDAREPAAAPGDQPALAPRCRSSADRRCARRMIDAVGKLAALDSTVLITGESGVGKGLVARLIHNSGPLAARPFVTVSCTALPRELVEAELFGHEKGAFTGAHERRPGRLEIADGGTLFLDEVGDMPLESQPKLLTFLQDRAFQRIGSNKTICGARADHRRDQPAPEDDVSGAAVPRGSVSSG